MATHPLTHGFPATLRRLFEEIGFALCTLNRMQFEAPWRPDRKRRC